MAGCTTPVPVSGITVCEPALCVMAMLPVSAAVDVGENVTVICWFCPGAMSPVDAERLNASPVKVISLIESVALPVFEMVMVWLFVCPDSTSPKDMF